MIDGYKFPTDKCLNCCAPDIERLLWKEANSDDFISFEKFKQGGLYACRNCMSFWYLDSGNEILTRATNIALLREWANMDFQFLGHLKEKLAEIGANPVLLYGSGRDRIEFPCRVITKDGKVHDPALIRLQKHPDFAGVASHHVSEIKHIEASDYSLNPQIRYATARAREISMMYDPTHVGVLNGPNYTLLGQNTFFHDGVYKGKDCLLGSTSKNAEWKDHFDHTAAKSVFVGLWNEELSHYRIDDPFLFFLTRNIELENTSRDWAHPDIIRQEILGGDLYLLAASRLNTLESILEELGLAPMHLVYDGIGFNRTGDAWKNFDKNVHAGVITMAPDASLGALNFEANIFINLLKDIGGMHVLLGFSPEWKKEIQQKQPRYMDLEALIRDTTGAKQKQPLLDYNHVKDQ